MDATAEPASCRDRRRPRRRRGTLLLRLLGIGGLAGVAALVGLYLHAGSYGLHVLLRHGGTYWIRVDKSSRRLSPSMRLALGGAPPAVAGTFAWRTVAAGFEVADLPAVADGGVVDHLLLARIDPARFRFVVRNAPDGDTGLDQWMTRLGAVLVVDGSYYARDGRPATPVLSNGRRLGPQAYDARAGAFVAGARFTGLRDLAHLHWSDAFDGADDALVSYPLLVADGAARVTRSSGWLANRSFVGQDRAGRIVIGTTTDGFFALDRFARFLHEAPLDLDLALNLDGGPVASQAISLNGYERRTHGRWEAQVRGDRVSLLTWPFGTVAMPVVIAVLPR